MAGSVLVHVFAGLGALVDVHASGSAVVVAVVADGRARGGVAARVGTDDTGCTGD